MNTPDTQTTLYCFQLSTGLIFKTIQDILFTDKGYCIDRQDIDDIEPVNGSLHSSLSDPGYAMGDMMFKNKDVIASWKEII